MAVLPTNYLDDILAASMGGKRRFRITHEDGSTEEVTLEDVSEYEQVGSPFGSGDVNKTNQTVNEKLDSADVVDPALATVLGFAADAKLTGDALSELNKNITISYANTYIFERIGKKCLLSINGTSIKHLTTELSLGEYAPKRETSAPVWIRREDGKALLGKIVVNPTGIYGQYIENFNDYAKDFSPSLNMFVHGQIEWYL